MPNCEFCSNPILNNQRAGVRYCSHTCSKKSYVYKKYESRKQSIQPQTCEFCQQTYLPTRLSSVYKFCSTHCKDEHHKSEKRKANEAKRQSAPTRNCEFCKNSYLPSRGHNGTQQKFCSITCQSDWHKEQSKQATAQKRASVIKQCPICKVDFSPKKSLKQEYCSRKCCYLWPKKCYKALQRCHEAIGTKKEYRTTVLLGYTPRQLQEHIQNHPNWNSVKDGDWHLDHIFPIIAFLKKGIKDLKIINCLSNLRPISEEENCSKNDKYDQEEFDHWLAELTLNSEN
jgi:hypothetical protein